MIRFLSLSAILFLLASCESVKSTLDDAKEGLNDVFEAEEAPQEVDSDDLVTAETLYQDGLSARRSGDHTSAVPLFEEAAELGHGPAAYEAALAYSQGEGVDKDLAKAADWLSVAAQRGDARAQYLAGVNYLTGNGVPKDPERSAALFGEAALQDHARAQYQLGEAFANGTGVPKDLSWASRWYGKAAQQGLPEAQFAYGVFHAAGRGLPKNEARGYPWLVLAARNGHADAEPVRDAVASRLSRADKSRGDSAANSFRAHPTEKLADHPTVMYVQHRLNGLGYSAGTVDGIMGPRTSAAITGYQSQAGLSPDGQVSVSLLESLRATGTPSS